MKRVLVVCEDPSDFRIVKTLCERALREEAAEWLRDYFEQFPEHVLVWTGARADEPCALWRQLDELRSTFEVKPPLGRFAGERGAMDALAARTALAIARHLKRQKSPLVDAVILMRDMDDQPERRKGLEQAREEARGHDPDMPVLVGAALPKIEAWLIEGFEPLSKEEEELVAEVRQEIGFDPRLYASDLTAKHDHDKKSCKRVLAVLTRSEPERKEQCVRATPLPVLRQRGQASGLDRLLGEIVTTLLPLCEAAGATAPK